jgi:hypothetical protein
MPIGAALAAGSAAATLFWMGSTPGVRGSEELVPSRRRNPSQMTRKFPDLLSYGRNYLDLNDPSKTLSESFRRSSVFRAQYLETFAPRILTAIKHLQEIH